MARRRVSFWRAVFRLLVFVLVVLTLIWIVRLLVPGGSTSWVDSVTAIFDSIQGFASGQQLIPLLFSLPIFFLFNALIFIGPMMLIGVSQMRGFEPGDADWGVRLADVRGQDEAKEEVSRVVTLWQSGEAFEQAGGKRERGLLFLGAPGTGKTMLAKAIATGFNCPFVLMPGSGFQQTFMGMDAVIVRWLARKAKKLARKWGGQCIVFIDEIDAVGMRRAALGGGASSYTGARIEESLFYGPYGALNPTGDMILETRAWRERLFTEREPKAPPTGLGRIFNQGGGGMRRDDGRRRPACAEPAPRRDGRDRQPALLPAPVHELDEHAARRELHHPAEGRQVLAPRPAPEAAQGPDLLHRRDQRPDQPARSGADASGAHGPPRVAPHADEDRPQGHPRPLHREGRARAGAGRGQEARRARPHHGRLQPGDAGAGLLDGAHVRPCRRSRALRLGRHPRGHDDRRVRNRGQHRVPGGGHTGRGPPRVGARGREPRLHEGLRVDADLDPHARRVAGPPPGGGAGRALQPVALRPDGDADLGPRRDGSRARVLRADDERSRR